MPHFICRWPGGDVLLASVDSRQELDAILQERCEPGVCKVARYHGPLVLELKPDIPGVACTSAERFKLGPACPSFQAAWHTRSSTGDIDLLAADGSSQRVHSLVLQCRLPVLGGAPLQPSSSQVRLQVVPDGSCLLTLVEYLYLDDVQEQSVSHSLYQAALHCGLQRLVTRCEAHYAHQLDLQLLSWPGLVEAQRETVLDSFIAWANFTEQQDRQQLLQLCVHALALHFAAAQSRPSWSSLSPKTASQVHLVAASTAPPIIHRQVLPNGSAILPVLSNPGPDPNNPAPAAGQPQAAAPANIVSVDAEAFAAAGGRMTSWEWQQLQGFRDAVSECKSTPEASPLQLDAQQLSSHSFTAGEPGVSFAVKQAVLTPHRRLMDSVCRFAFPATHSLLAAGWQLQPPSQVSPAGSATAANSHAHASWLSRANAQQQQQPQQATSAQQVGHTSTEQQQQPGLQEQPQQEAQQAGPMILPVPAPVVHPMHQPAAPGQQQGMELLEGCIALGARASVGSDNGSCVQPHSSPAAVASWPQPEPAVLTRLGSLPTLTQAHAATAAGSRPADPALQLRVQAAAGAAAAAVNSRSSGQGPEGRQFWGSARGADSQAHSMQQQQASGTQSWGTGISGRQPSTVSLQAASTASGLSMGGVLQLCQLTGHGPAGGRDHGQQHAAGELLHAQESPQEAGSIDGVNRARAWGSDGASSDGQPTSEPTRAAVAQEHLQHVVQQRVMQLEGAGSIEAAQLCPGARWGSTSTCMPAQDHTSAGGILDLPAFWQPHRQQHDLISTSSAGAEQAPSAAQHTDPPQEQQQHEQPPVNASSGLPNSGTAGPCALTALQRALVEDFVLYEEASAARQHVVGILVAVEQGDAAAGQRLLAPACAELIAATAPAAVPNRLAPYLNSPAMAAAAARARASGLPAASVASAAAVAAAEEYCKSTQGIQRLLGSAASSRAALEASPRQLKQQRQQQQLLLVRALRQVSNRVPWLSRLLTPLQQSLGLGSAEATSAGADSGSPAAPAQPAAHSSGSPQGAGSAGTQLQPAMSLTQQEASAEVPSSEAGQGPGAVGDAAAGQHELQAAVVELIMQLPELLHGLPGPALLTLEQYRQRHTQAQQLAAHAMQLLLPSTGEDSSAGAVDGVAAELAASGLLAAASAAMAASQTGPAGDAAPGSLGQAHSQAGHLFANILDSLRGPGASTAAEQVTAGAGSAEAALAAAYGARAAAGANGFLSRTAAFAAANRLADGLIRPPPIMPPSSIGLSRAGSLAGTGQLGAWRLPAGAAGAAATGGLVTPAAAAGVLGMGMFAPTGTGALLSGGLLAEGGVAGDSILDDVLHGNVRRITCHGLYELCAALAQPADAQGSPPAAAQQQQPGEMLAAALPAYSMETDDSNRSSEGRVTGQHVAEAVATVAAAAAAVESNRRSSNHSMGPPTSSLAGSKRRLSSSLEEQVERPAKH